MPPEVEAAYGAFPEDVRAQLLEVRALILEEAEARGIGPVTETLK